MPLREQGIEFLRLARLLVMQGVEEIIVLGAGDEFLEDGGPVGGEREFFQEANFLLGAGREREAGKHGQRDGESAKTGFHEHGWDEWKRHRDKRRLPCSGGCSIPEV